MPCSEFGHTLVYHSDKHDLYCPACFDSGAGSSGQIKKKATQIRNDYLNNSQLIDLLKDYGSFRVVSELLHELNRGASGLTDENRMAFEKFFTPVPLLKALYKNWEEFDHHLDPDNAQVQEEIADNIGTLLKAGSVLTPVLKHIEEDFALGVEPVSVGSWTDFYADNDFEHTEYWLCSERCNRATVGAREEFRQHFLEQQEAFRTFTKPEKEEIDTVREFGDYWYGFIVSLGFTATLDDSLQRAFTTGFPDYVTIFDIEELLSRVDSAIEEQLRGLSSGSAWSFSLEESEFDACGKNVFGSDWDEVKQCLMVSPSNPNAHPMFFKVSGTQEVNHPRWRQSRSMPLEKVLYPDKFSIILKFQLFPLLKNGEMETSADVLDDLTAKRGLEFERNLFEYLQAQGFEAYHGCKTSKQNENEVDVIFVKDGTLYFVEAKFVLPTLNMQTQQGIEDVNDTFDEKIFEDGPAFDEKVETWLELDPGFEFTHQRGAEDTDRVTEQIPSRWADLDTEMLVVSNFVPSYLEKREVRFLTDLEFHQWIGYDEDVFIDVMTPPRQS